MICGFCGHAYGRKVWNSTDDRLRRISWRCNGKYVEKGERGCDSRHIDDRMLYQAFVDVFNMMVENKEYFLEKWEKRQGNENVLMRYKSKQLLEIITGARPITEFDIDLYFAMVEKVKVYDAGRMDVSLLDGTELECEME